MRKELTSAMADREGRVSTRPFAAEEAHLFTAVCERNHGVKGQAQLNLQRDDLWSWRRLLF